VSPDEWVFNYSNLTGLITHMLGDESFERIVGMCDGDNLGQTRDAAWPGFDPEEHRVVVLASITSPVTKSIHHGEWRHS
jgi:alpha-galactosidase/6-phospho-beta-glucosidase family protein